MNVTVKTASVRPMRSSAALDNSTTRSLSILRIRWRLMTSISLWDECNPLSPRLLVSPSPCLPVWLEVDLLIVVIVSLDDHLHQLMADDVALVEVDEGDSLDAADDALRFHKARLAPRRQVDLRHVARYHGLRPEADA